MTYLSNRYRRDEAARLQHGDITTHNDPRLNHAGLKAGGIKGINFHRKARTPNAEIAIRKIPTEHGGRRHIDTDSGPSVCNLIALPHELPASRRIARIYVCPVRPVAALVFAVILFSTANTFAVRPFVTDDARIIYRGQLETETYGGVTMAERDKPGIEARALQGFGITDRLEIIAGGFGFNYQENQARPLDMLFQPKVLLHRSFGAIPSVSAAVASLFPLSGNRQQWNSYAMAHVSWFLFTPQDTSDPYDNNLAIHINLGTKSQYDAGPGTYRSKLYWAAAFEVVTPFTRQVRFLGEVFNGDPFGFEEKFPAFQTGFRWYKTPNVQMDVVFRGVRQESDGEGRLGRAVTEVGPGWNYTFQVGLRVLFDVFR